MRKATENAQYSQTNKFKKQPLALGEIALFKASDLYPWALVSRAEKISTSTT